MITRILTRDELIQLLGMMGVDGIAGISETLLERVDKEHVVNWGRMTVRNLTYLNYEPDEMRYNVSFY